jgi:phosphoserine phosphatase
MQPKPFPALVVYVDVDNTLVRTSGAGRVPLPEMVKHVADLKREGAVLFCWSSAGACYAQKVAEELQIAHCFSNFLPKPHVEIDDQAITDWPYFRHFYPTQASRHTVADYRRILEED